MVATYTILTRNPRMSKSGETYLELGVADELGAQHRLYVWDSKLFPLIPPTGPIRPVVDAKNERFPRITSLVDAGQQELRPAELAPPAHPKPDAVGQRILACTALNCAAALWAGADAEATDDDVLATADAYLDWLEAASVGERIGLPDPSADGDHGAEVPF